MEPYLDYILAGAAGIIFPFITEKLKGVINLGPRGITLLLGLLGVVLAYAGNLLFVKLGASTELSMEAVFGLGFGLTESVSALTYRTFIKGK